MVSSGASTDGRQRSSGGCGGGGRAGRSAEIQQYTTLSGRSIEPWLNDKWNRNGLFPDLPYNLRRWGFLFSSIMYKVLVNIISHKINETRQICDSFTFQVGEGICCHLRCSRHFRCRTIHGLPCFR